MSMKKLTSPVTKTFFPKPKKPLFFSPSLTESRLLPFTQSPCSYRLLAIQTVDESLSLTPLLKAPGRSVSLLLYANSSRTVSKTPLMLQKFIYCLNYRYCLHISFIFLFYHVCTIEFAFFAIDNNT